jgi:hypothetical protein
MNYLFEAMKKQLSIGGKVFCWHDWILLSHSCPRDAWEYAHGINAEYLCVKCGKSKRSQFESEVTRYDGNNRLIS